MKSRKIIKFSLFFLIAMSLQLFAAYNVKRISWNDFNYSIIYDKNYDIQSLKKFHFNFQNSIDELFEKYNIKKPYRYNISICMGAWIFSDVTGQKRNVAAIYDSSNNVFYFQRPAALRKKGNYHRVISHEILHHVIDIVREKNGSENEKEKRTWLEESFCEAMYPGTNYSSKGIKKLNLKSMGLLKFQNFLKNGFSSKSVYKKKTAYYYGYLWGSFLVKECGERKFLNMLTGNKYDEVLLNKYFKIFILRNYFF